MLEVVVRAINNSYPQNACLAKSISLDLWSPVFMAYTNDTTFFTNHVKSIIEVIESFKYF